MRKPDLARKSCQITRRQQLTRGSKLGSPLRLEALEERLALAALPGGFTETQITSGLASPTAMEFSPTGEAWVLEEAGNVRLVLGPGNNHLALTVAVNDSGERGLLGITFDPSYDGIAGPNTDYVYLYYTDPTNTGDTTINNRLSRFTLVDVPMQGLQLQNELILRDLPPNTEDGDSNHNGGAIHFGPDGKLYVAVGDHNYDTVSGQLHVAQINSTPFGKILRLDPDGTNPGDNPFDNGSETSWEGAIWAKGLRNPYTFAFDADGTMFINDVGEGAWEEINLGEAGANYGWAGSNSTIYEGYESTPPPWAVDYRDPIMAYDHSNTDGAPAGVAITGGAFYPGNGPYGGVFGGRYFFADFGAGFIRMFDPDNPGESTVPATEGDEDTSIPFATGASSPVDLKVDAAGRLHYLGRSGGVLYRIDFNGNYGPTQVNERQIFYNQSGFDGDSAAINDDDDDAIADDKNAYRPGDGLAGSDNVTSYVRGINGIMIDLAGNHGPLSLADFTFKMSPAGLDVNNSPSTWTAAPAPIGFTVRASEGVGDTNRVEFVWADGAIKDRWLEVIVEGNDAAGGSNANTGLAASDIFFFGNKVGATFLSDDPGAFKSDQVDQIHVRYNQGITLAVSNVFDFNRDFNVDPIDEIIARFNQGYLLAIDISNPPAAPPSGDDDSSAVASALAIRTPTDALRAVSSHAVVPSPATTRRVAKVLAHAGEIIAPRIQAILAAVDDLSGVEDDLLAALLEDVTAGQRLPRGG